MMVNVSTVRKRDTVPAIAARRMLTSKPAPTFPKAKAKEKHRSGTKEVEKACIGSTMHLWSPQMFRPLSWRPALREKATGADGCTF